MSSWHVLVVGKGTPPAVIAKLESTMKSIVADPDYIKALKGIGSTPIYRSGKECETFLKNERKVLGALIKRLGLSNIK